MKMLLLVAGDFFEDDLTDALLECDITKYTIVSKSHGVGGARTEGTIVIFAAVTEHQADLATNVLKNLRTHKVEIQQGKPFPLRLFCMPCEQLL